MNNVILAIDDNDETLGGFFRDCQDDLQIHYSTLAITPTLLRSHQLNDAAIQLTTAQHKSFVFGAYSHGDIGCLLEAARNPYVSIELNGRSFKNSFFYTCSCYTGKELGGKLIDEGCLCYIGYQNTFGVWTYNCAPFIECANYGLKLFFEGQNTNEIIRLMKIRYTEHIDNYKNDMFGAAVLTSNRESLVKHGQEITIQALN